LVHLQFVSHKGLLINGLLMTFCLIWPNVYVDRVLLSMNKHLVYQSLPFHFVHLLILWGLKIKCRGLKNTPTTGYIAQNG